MINPVGVEVVNFDFAEKVIYTGNNLDALKEIAKYLVDEKDNLSLTNLLELKKSLENVFVSDEIKEVASAYNNAKKAMIVFQENVLSVDAATMIANIALVSNHIGAPRDGNSSNKRQK